MCVQTSKGADWMDDSRLNPGLVRDVQERDAVLRFKKKGHKPEWYDISAQGSRIQVVL